MKKIMSVSLAILMIAALCMSMAGCQSGPKIVAEGVSQHEHGMTSYFLWQEYDDGSIVVHQVTGGSVAGYESYPWGETYKGTITKGDDGSGKTVASFTFDTYVIDLSLGMSAEDIAANEALAAVNGVEQAYEFDVESVEVNEDGSYTVTFVYDMAGSATNPVEIVVLPVKAKDANDSATWIESKLKSLNDKD